MTRSTTPLLRVLQTLVVGPRDWYRIEHCKTERNKTYFRVCVCIWRDAWPNYYQGDSVYLNSAIAAVIESSAEEYAPSEAR
jgi:hypothetical protein